MNIHKAESNILIAEKVDVTTGIIVPDYEGYSDKVITTSLLRIRTKGKYYNNIYAIPNSWYTRLDMEGEMLYAIRERTLITECIPSINETVREYVTVPEFYGVEDYDVIYTGAGKITKQGRGQC